MSRFVLIGLFIQLSIHCWSQQDPCPGLSGSVIHFDKQTDSLFETPCDSLIHFVRYIEANPQDTFAILGIQTVRPGFETNSDIRIDKEKALNRAQRVKAALITWGIEPERLLIYTSYHQPPEDNEPHDWPFYPDSFNYEIGVYLQVHY